MLKCCGHCNAAIWIDFRGERSGDGAMSGNKAIFTYGCDISLKPQGLGEGDGTLIWGC
jgi:hypothetical protein